MVKGMTKAELETALAAAKERIAELEAEGGAAASTEPSGVAAEIARVDQEILDVEEEIREREKGVRETQQRLALLNQQRADLEHGGA